MPVPSSNNLVVRNGLIVMGGLAFPYVAKTATYTIADSDHLIDCISGTFTVTLPTAVDIPGKLFIVKNSGPGVITVATTSSQTIDGSATVSLIADENVQVHSDGTNWVIVGSGMIGDQGDQGSQGAPGSGGSQGYQGDQGNQGNNGSQGDQGNNGSQGYQGDNGSQGYQGDNGSQGYQGDQGNQGNNGSQGDQGNNGAQGDQGDNGTQGYQGDNGSQGNQGDQGNNGSQGDQGDNGSQGYQGDQGDQGNNGSQGDQGNNGSQGDQGDNGSQGYQGDNGPQGYQGDNGPQGYQGEQGNNGSQGDQGNNGSQGDQGNNGSQGDQGSNGYQGYQGDQGNQGNTGSFGGVTVEYLIDTTSYTVADPGDNYVRLNNANITLATHIIIDDNPNNANIDLSLYLSTVASSTSTIQGHLKISKKNDSTVFALYTISNVAEVDGGVSYFDVTVAYLSGSGSFSDDDEVLLTFARTGDKGDSGYQGSQGSQGNQGNQGPAYANTATITSQNSNYVVFSYADTYAKAVFIDYYVKNGSNAYRSGTITGVVNSSANTVSFTEVSVDDLGGTTSGIAFSLAITSNQLELTAVITSGTWDGVVGIRSLG
jgi:hypothetical protein